MKTENEVIQRGLQKLKSDCAHAEKQVDLAKQAAVFVDQVASLTRGAAKDQFEELISAALTQIYETPLRFEAFWSFKRNLPSLDFYINHGSVRRTLDGFGGGVSDVVSTALRILIATMTPEVPRLLVLDEPGKHLDEESAVNFGHFLMSLCDQLDWQIICITHSKQLAQIADAIYEVSKDGVDSHVLTRKSPSSTSGHLQQITLNRFESHQQSTVQFSNRFTAIVGPSNVGKTSLIRALSLLCYGRWSNEQVKLGNTSAVVSAKFQKGTIDISRGKGINQWSIRPTKADPITLKNTGREVPSPAMATHNIRTYEIGGISVALNIADQLEPHFLLTSFGGKDASSSLAAKVLDHLTGLDGMDELLKRLSKHRSSNQSRAKVYGPQIEEAESKLHDEQEIALLENKVSLCDQLERDFDQHSDFLSRLWKASDLFDDVDVQRSEIQSRRNSLPDLPATNACVNKLNILIKIIRRLKSLKIQLVDTQRQISAVRAEIPNLSNCDAAKKKIEELKDLKSDRFLALKARDLFDKVESQSVSLKTKISQMQVGIRLDEKKLKDWLKSLDPCPSCGQPTVKGVNPMDLEAKKSSILEAIQKMRDEEVRCKTRLEELEKYEKEMTEICEELNIQPTRESIQKAIDANEKKAEQIVAKAESLLKGE